MVVEAVTGALKGDTKKRELEATLRMFPFPMPLLTKKSRMRIPSDPQAKRTVL
jgi:hypothetical protein